MGVHLSKKDLATFDDEYDLMPAKLTIAYPEGTPSSNNEGWAEEASLDVEWAHALAPSANILLVVAKSASDNGPFTAVQYANMQNPQIISMSWGFPEVPYESSYDDPYFSHSGTVYLAASGDQSASVNYPAASPNVIAVGGTCLYLDANGNLTGSETAWSGSGGGVSSYETRPSWQTSFGIACSGNKRCAPDVAFDAAPGTGVNVYFDGRPFGGSAGWWVAGGTSLSTPCWAAILALVDQDTHITNADQTLFALAGSQSNFNPYGAYREITSGSNGLSGAKNGYSLVTGLGSPVANILVPKMFSAHAR